jgi:hypothetical protein
MRPFTDEDWDLAWTILKNLSDRAGIPEWLGDESDAAAKHVAWDVAALIATTHGALPEASRE